MTELEKEIGNLRSGLKNVENVSAGVGNHAHVNIMLPEINRGTWNLLELKCFCIDYDE